MSAKSMLERCGLTAADVRRLTEPYRLTSPRRRRRSDGAGDEHRDILQLFTDKAEKWRHSGNSQAGETRTVHDPSFFDRQYEGFAE
jgi:hypothetical protein